MDATKLRAHLFGSLTEDIDRLGDSYVTDETYANAIYDLYEKSAHEDSPAADLFRREKWQDLYSLLYPELPRSTAFTGTCMRRAIATRTRVDDVVTRILQILDNDCGGDVVTKIVALQESGGWEELVKELAPHLPAQDASTCAWQLKTVVADPDGLIAAIDADGAAGKITPREAVERMSDVYFGDRFLRSAVEDFVKKLFPTVPVDFRAGAATHLFNDLVHRRAVIHVHEVPPAPLVAAPAAAPEVTPEELEARAWTAATATIERLAQLIAPLTKAGLSSSDALEAANTAIGEAKIAIQATVKLVGADEPPILSPYGGQRLSGLARNYGATILGD